MASVAAPLRGLPLPANPRAQPRGRDIVSTILSNYGGDPGIEFTPTEENWPNKAAELRPPRFNRNDLYSPISESERGFASSPDDVAAEYDPYRQDSDLRSRKTGNLDKWQTKTMQQSKEDVIKEPAGKIAYEDKVLPAPPLRVDSKFGKGMFRRVFILRVPNSVTSLFWVFNAYHQIAHVVWYHDLPR